MLLDSIIWFLGSKPNTCDEIGCTRNIASPSVFDLYRAPFSKKLKLYKNGKISFEDLRTESDLTDFQRMQVVCTLQNQSYINSDEIKKFLSQLSYPRFIWRIYKSTLLTCGTHLKKANTMFQLWVALLV